MRQSITKKQWNELSDKEKDIWVEFFLKQWRETPEISDMKKDFGGWNEMMFNTAPESTPLLAPYIGEMIEFLGDNLTKIELCSIKDNFFKGKNYGIGRYVEDNSIMQIYILDWKYLKDALWESCKFKLRDNYIERKAKEVGNAVGNALKRLK